MIPRRGFLSWLGLAPAAVAIAGAPAAAASPIFARLRPMRAASIGEPLALIEPGGLPLPGKAIPIRDPLEADAYARLDRSLGRALECIPMPPRGKLVETDNGFVAPAEVVDKVIVSERADGMRLLTVIVRDAIVFRQLLDQAQAAHLAALLTAPPAVSSS